MIITQEIIDFIAPAHGRTSCNDNDIANAYGGWTGEYSMVTGRKDVIHPRCTRCYLMKNVGVDSDDLEFSINCALEFKENT